MGYNGVRRTQGDLMERRVNRVPFSSVCPSSERGLRIRKALIVAAFGAAFLGLYVVEPTFENWRTDIPRVLLPLMVLVAVAVLAVLVDPISRPGSKPTPHASFFQAQSPKLHIRRKHNLPTEEARRAWLSVFRQWNSESHPNHSYYAACLRRRYECQAIYYLEWVSLRAFVLCVAALVVLAFLSLFAGAALPGFYTFENTALAAARIAFPVLPLGIYLCLRATNRPDPDDPTGVWRSWREVNDSLKAWWDENEGQRES